MSAISDLVRILRGRTNSSPDWPEIGPVVVGPGVNKDLTVVRLMALEVGFMFKDGELVGAFNWKS